MPHCDVGARGVQGAPEMVANAHGKSGFLYAGYGGAHFAQDPRYGSNKANLQSSANAPKEAPADTTSMPASTKEE